MLSDGLRQPQRGRDPQEDFKKMAGEIVHWVACLPSLCEIPGSMTIPGSGSGNSRET